jgi:Tol biopolymer transport system component
MSNLKQAMTFAVIISFSFLLGSCAVSSGSKVSGKLSKLLVSLSVPEEGGMSFVKITDDGDAVASPGFAATTKQTVTSNPGSSINWYLGSVIDISPDGKSVGYINYKNDMTNVMIKSALSGGGSTQRTFRNDVRNFSWSPDGARICFTEYRNGKLGIYMADANQGAVVRQMSSSSYDDSSPVVSVSRDKGERLFFHRYEGDKTGVRNNNFYTMWSYDLNTGLFSNYSRGMTPCIDNTNPDIVYCVRFTSKGASEIWKVNTATGAEELLLSQKDRDFSNPKISPDGRWILVSGTSKTPSKIFNIDLFVVRPNGNDLTQLTYHPGNDMSGVWAPNGKSIYFVSQRGSKDGIYNVWKMDFTL